jgi:hypothetical protein
VQRGAGAAEGIDRQLPYRLEVSGFCAAIRVGTPLRCGPERAAASARPILAAHEAAQTKSRIVLA